MEKGGANKQERFSNLELYRIIVMLLIVAHHSIVNSGVMGLMAANPFAPNSIFAYLFGMWGKTGINCFVLITGYFMCTSHITGRKFAKLVLEVLFYNIVIASIFWLTGYAPMTLKRFVGMLMPIRNMTNGFTSAFLMFFLTIPFLNKLVHSLSQREHLLLVLLTTGMYVFLPYIPLVKIQMNYVVWFAVIYIIASYLRLHADKIYKSDSAKFWGWMSLLSIFAAQLSVFANLWLRPGKSAYIFVSDSNAILAVIIAICTFMWFKNLNIRQSRFINVIAASCFGVLLIHANSDTMRQWLWYDTANVQNLYRGGQFAIKIILWIIGIYVVCTLLDYLRIRFIEKPVLKLLDNNLANCKWW